MTVKASFFCQEMLERAVSCVAASAGVERAGVRGFFLPMTP